LPNGGCIWPWSCWPALFSASAPEDSTTTLDPWGPCVCVRLTPQILVLFLFGEWSRPHLYMVTWSAVGLAFDVTLHVILDKIENLCPFPL
jgi:hypothetical protein